MAKNVSLMVIILFLFSMFAGCASTAVQGRTAQERAEQRKEERANMARVIGSFAGLVAGGLLGLASSEPDTAVGASLTGALVGGVVGFGAGHLIGENLKELDEKPDSSGAEERFRDYRNIQLKD